MLRLHIEKDGDTILSAPLIHCPVSLDSKDGTYRCVGIQNNLKAIKAFMVIAPLIGLKEAKDFALSVNDQNPWIWDNRELIWTARLGRRGFEDSNRRLAECWDAFIWHGEVPPVPTMRKG